MVSAGTLTRSGLPEVITPNERRFLRLGALAGVTGLALRFVATGRYQNPLNSNVGGMFGYPESGVEPALAGALGVLLMAFALIVLYRSLAERAVARIVALVGVGGVLALTLSGFEMSVDGAVVGSVFLAFGVALATRRTYPTWLGWLGVASGIALILGASASVQMDFSGRPSEVERATALFAGLFVLAVSVAMWLRSRVPSPLKGAK